MGRPHLVLALLLAACDCSASHRRDSSDAAAPRDAELEAAFPEDAGGCHLVTRIPLEGDDVFDIAHAGGHVAVTLSRHVALLADGSDTAEHVPLPPELVAVDGHGALIAPGDGFFLLARGATVARMGAAGTFGPIATLAVENELPQAVDLERRLEGDRFAALVWDAHPGDGEDLPPSGPSKMFLLDAAARPTAPPVVVNAEDHTATPEAIGSQTDAWWYARPTWDEVGERTAIDLYEYSLEGELVTHGCCASIGDEPPAGGDPLDLWLVDRMASDLYQLAWVNRSRIAGTAPEESLWLEHVPWYGPTPRELARAPSIGAFSTTGTWFGMLVAWSQETGTIHLDGFGDGVPTDTIDVGPGIVRTVQVTSTSEMTFAIAYGILVPEGRLEAWLVRVGC